MTLLVASISVEEVSSLPDVADRAFASGADAVELRLDSYDGDPLAIADFLRDQPGRRWIVTYRSVDEGGSFHGDTMERVSKLLAACRGTGATVDFEWVDWSRSGNIRQKVRLACGGVDDCDRLILSVHDFEKRPSDIAQVADAIVDVDGLTAAKVAYKAATILDSFDALDLMRTHRDRVIAIAMGEDGVWTRVLSRKLGAFASYAAVDAATAPGQLTLDQMHAYRFAAIGPQTRVFGVLGDPVSRSMSPLVFNCWFAAAGIDAVYVPLRVRGGISGLRSFLDECRKRPWLDVGGFSVTLPHKRAAYDWAGIGADSMSRGIGAANTLAFDGDAVRAYNTDAYAAVGAMAGALECSRADFSGMTVDILGAGGAARAVAYALHELGCQQTLYARSAEKAEPFVASLGCAFKPWEMRHERCGEIVINCTSLGFSESADETPLPPSAFDGCRLAFDMIYNPLETVFLTHARQAGVATLNGLDMFVRQAATQFELWTGQRPDSNAAARWIVDAIESESGAG